MMSTGVADGLSVDEFQVIIDIVRERSAIVLETRQQYLVESRLEPVLQATGLDSMRSLVRELRAKNRLVQDRVVDAMTTNETSFFRDSHPFDLLRTKLLPELIERRKESRRLAIWSNACSSGQEIYSIAMLIHEHYPELLEWDLQLWATDLSQSVLDKARRGCFTQTEVNRGLPMQYMLRYFVRDGVQWQIKENIRDLVSFQKVNLIETWPTMIQSIDIALLRNVLIYFKPDVKRKILSRMRNRIQDDGCLFLGGSETTMKLTEEFQMERIDRAVFYRPVI